eukprot:Tbor_TRINITY_DN5250_c0_g6::TRINITY_DN5250_c0_g6_i2::g.16653::m.16653
MNNDELFAGDGTMMEMTKDVGGQLGIPLLPGGSKTYTDPSASTFRADEEPKKIFKNLFDDTTDTTANTAIDAQDNVIRSTTSDVFDFPTFAGPSSSDSRQQIVHTSSFNNRSQTALADQSLSQNQSQLEFSNLNCSGVAGVQSTVDLKANNAARVQKQQEEIKARTKQIDEDNSKSVAATKEAAKEYLANLETKRQYYISTVRADHIKEQQLYEQKMSQFKSKGAVWESVNLLANLSKPNPHSVNTEGMRNIINSLASSKAAAPEVL